MSALISISELLLVPLGIAILVAYGISFLWGLARTHRIGDMGQRLADDVVEEALPGAA